MPSVVALRAIVSASLGLGVVDLVWINAALAPDVIIDRVASEPAVPREQPPAPAPVADPPVPVRETSPEPRVVYFETSSAKLDGDARAILRALVDEAPPDSKLVLEGHADLRGREALNERLSRDRAHAVARYLAELGIPRARVRVEYLGESAASAVGDEAWRDRRVDIQITGGSR